MLKITERNSRNHHFFFSKYALYNYLELMGEEDIKRIAVGKPRIVMALPEGGNPSGNIYTAPVSTEG